MKSPEIAYQDIAGKIRNLTADTLLFTKSLEEINWDTVDETGHYWRDTISINDRAKEVCINASASDQHSYLIFDHPIFWLDEKGIKKEHRPVQIAFGLDKQRNKGGVIKKIPNAKLFVFFPTTKETHVGFILQGPYRTNPPRENVFPDDEFNKHLVNKTAKLLTESLNQLKELNLLNLETLSILPIYQAEFEKGIFEPIYLEFCETLRTTPLLPKRYGGYATANESRLARGAKLADVFDDDQLGKLFGREKLEWLDTSLTINNYPDLHRFLTDLVDDIEITPDILALQLTAEFLQNQSIEWLIKFALYAEKRTDKIKQCPFVRLESGDQVSLPKDDEVSVAWFTPENSTWIELAKNFPLVHHKLSENTEVRKFLEKEGIREIKAVDVVEQCILTKYQDTPPNEKTLFREYEEVYCDHLRLIGKAYADADDETKEHLNNSLNSIEWLACIHASGNELDKVFWKAPESEDLYAIPNGKVGFTVPKDKSAYFLHPSAIKILVNYKSINDYLYECIKPIDTLTIVNDFILPIYQKPHEFNEPNYRNDLQWICKAFSGDDSVKEQLKKSLSPTMPWIQKPTWLACVHASGKNPDEITWRKTDANDLFAMPTDKQTFRVPENMDGYFLHHSVVEEFSKNESARLFLEGCVKKMDAVAIVDKFILPKYLKQDTSVEIDEAIYRADLQWIAKASSSINRHLIASKIENTAWLACVHASGERSNCIVWEKSNARRLFKLTEVNCNWFTGVENVDAYFLHPIVNEEISGLADELVNSIGKGELVKKQIADNQNHVVISNSYGFHRRGLDGFDPNFNIIGITQVLEEPTLKQSNVLWNLLLNNSECIRGFIESSSRSTYLKSRKTEEFSILGNQLYTSKWIPDKTGTLCKPSELALTDLPEKFDTKSPFAIKVADKLGMKKPEFVQAIDIIAGDDFELKRLIECYQSASNVDKQKILKMIPQEILPQPVPLFKDGLKSLCRPQRGKIESSSNESRSNYPLTNPEHYQNKVNQAVEERLKQHQSEPQSIRFSPVRESPSNIISRDFLYNEYRGKCQITGHTFSKAWPNSNGESENYFEACSLLSYLNPCSFGFTG